MILVLIFDALKTAYEKTEQKERLTQHKSKKKKKKNQVLKMIQNSNTHMGWMPKAKQKSLVRYFKK